jgi:hypothetical protein
MKFRVGQGGTRAHGSRRGFATRWALGSCSRWGIVDDPALPKEHIPERRNGKELFVMPCWDKEAPKAPSRD